MQTRLAEWIKQTPKGREAERILRKCVHCGFCNAVCPTYQLRGDELDSPRGRIYLIKQLLEGDKATQSTQLYLDRCLTCRACETTCPSGVEYVKVLDIGREVVESRVSRPLVQKCLRRLILFWLPYSARVAALLTLLRTAAFLLPPALRAKLPSRAKVEPRPLVRHPRKMLILEGCVQPATRPDINAKTIQILDKLGISVISNIPGCCGALPYHLNSQQTATDMMRCLIDACWPHIESGIEAIVTTASGCGVTVKDYAYFLKDDPEYVAKATRVSALAKDVVEILQQEDLSAFQIKRRRIAFHSPCTLQHGLRLNGQVERLLTQIGYTLTPVVDGHLCCGSAGTYSLFQAKMANRLRMSKLNALQAEHPEFIATANIGCLLHLQEKATVPVLHWIELLSEA
jgi:glycolate oxidase iron-sulfur subunit